MLKFLGTGSAFNTELGNTSAFIKEGNSLFLIDCGSSTFKVLKESNILNDVKHLEVFITHTHADHVGSLADLIFYMHFVMGAVDDLKVNVHASHKVQVGDLLALNGVKEGIHYNRVKISIGETYKVPHFRNLFLHGLAYNSHVDTMHSTSIEIYYNGIVMFYSGDTSTLATSVVEKIKSGYYDFVYVDTSFNDTESKFHMHYGHLSFLLDDTKFRDRIHCMHLDVSPEENLTQLKELGFKIARSIFHEDAVKREAKL